MIEARSERSSLFSAIPYCRPHLATHRATSLLTSPPTSFFGESDDGSDKDAAPVAAQDELAEYMKLEQVSNKVNPTEWWKERAGVFPNLEVMARQYLGCPASSASVERLFLSVGVAFSDKRQSAKAATLESIMFTRGNL